MLETNENLEKELENKTTNTLKETKSESNSEVANAEEAIQEVEEQVAEAAEKDDEKNSIPMLDYEAMDLEKLVSELEKLLKGNPVQHIKNQADGIKNAFNKKFGTLLAEKKEAFLAEGGNSIDFQFSSPVKSTYNKLLSEYKTKRDAYYAEIEKQRASNLEKRVQVIDGLKNLIENADPKTMYKQFTELQNTWRSIGPVPKNKYNDTWRTYHHHVERFYDLLHLSKDFRDLDFKNNLEEKIKLIDRAEALVDVEDVNVAFKELQNLHKLWKEDIGPVAREMREEVWQRFSEATKKIHDRRHQYFRELKSKYQDVIDEKLKVVDLINAYDFSSNKTHKDWQNSIKEIETLRKSYFDAGKLPYSKSEAVWQKFKAATKRFNTAKNSFYKDEKKSQSDNLKKKLALIEIAESLKESDDWENATNTMKKIQSDWKKIGHVPRKFSDEIWTKFKAACNHYFDRLYQRKNVLSAEQQAVVSSKEKFLEAFSATKDVTKETIVESLNQWTDMGRLPRSAKSLEAKFNKQLDAFLSKLDIDKDEISMLKFTSIVNGYLANNDVRKLDSEQLFIRKKLDETVKEIQQLENNVGFISNASDDNPLLKNVKDRIEGYKKELTTWKKKLSYLRNLEY